MSQEDHLKLVREIYDAVGRGDVAAILDRVTDDVDWSAEAAAHAAPWHGPRTGPSGVASFFADLAGSIEITEFIPHAFATGEDDEGRQYRDHGVHPARLRDRRGRRPPAGAVDLPVDRHRTPGVD